MKINGVELEFSLYNSANTKMKERYFKELEKLGTLAQGTPQGADEGEKIDYVCNRVKNLFDTVFGEDTGKNVCGELNDLMVCMGAFEQLVSEQIRQQREYDAIQKRIQGLTDRLGEMA